jgi:hypothetical protein
MRITRSPEAYQSMFRPACFTIEDMSQAPDGVDIEISAVGRVEPLGAKRLYPAAARATATVNVAPYARRVFDPAPMCGSAAGIYPAAGRHVACFVSGGEVASPAVVLCGGSHDAEWNSLLSAAPEAVKIAPGEKDEMSVISEDWIFPVVTFSREGVTYTDTSMGRCSAEGVVTAVVDADAVAERFRSLTGGATSELAEFTVRLKLDQYGFSGRKIERRYTLDRTPRAGRRLAWVNRYGVVDYHTFPACEEFRSTGGRTVVETTAGPRTVATRARQSLRLISEPCGAVEAEWLSEIFSSPAVWMIDGADFEKVEVAAGEVVCSPLLPTVVSVVVSPAEGAYSRKI